MTHSLRTIFKYVSILVMTPIYMMFVSDPLLTLDSEELQYI